MATNQGVVGSNPASRATFSSVFLLEYTESIKCVRLTSAVTRSSTCPTASTWPTGRPAETGSSFRLPPTLRSLEPFREDLLVLSGLAQQNASPMGDEGGDHARSLACFLTGTHPLKTDGANIRAGVSIDQVAAVQIGHRTRLPSLELGIDPSAQAGSCDSGYSCAYSSNISWKSANMPMAKEIDPRLVFDRLFGARPRDASPADRASRERHERSVLDFVLRGRPAAPRAARDERPAQDRRVSQRRPRDRAADRAGPTPSRPAPGRRPAWPGRAGSPSDLREHIRLMLDLMALAFQADVDADQHVHVRQRGEQPGLSLPQRARRPPRPLAPRQRPQEAREDQGHQPLPRRAVRLPARQAQVDEGRATARCSTTS